jgi:fructose-specific phosphotransferase system IIA component
MNLVELLDNELIELNLKDGNKFEIIEQLLNIAVEADRVRNSGRALKDLIEREQYLSTGFENGLAVPHAKSEAVDEMVLVFGLHRSGIDFDSLDGELTHFVFLLLSPMDTSGPHIQTLALIARNFQNPDVIESLKQVNDPAELTTVLSEFK